METISQIGGRARIAAAKTGGFLFDVDGVLADTAALHTAAWARLAEEEGWPFDRATAESLRGVSREESLRRILRGRDLPPERFDELCARKNHYYLESVARLTSDFVLPGLRRLLDDLRNLGMARAAVSASRNARTVLNRLGLEPAFEAIIDGHTESSSRTGLNRYLLAAAALRLSPQRCVVVEDAAAGVALARAAGMPCIGIGDPRRLCAATMVFESFRGVDAKTLLNWLDAVRADVSPRSCCLPPARV